MDKNIFVNQRDFMPTFDISFLKYITTVVYKPICFNNKNIFE